MWQVGAARVNITYFEPEIGLLGWGNSRHVAHTVESQLYARAFCFQTDTDPPHFWIEADICFITVALRQEVYLRLRQSFPDLAEAHLMLTANHTHAAPGGFSHHLLYHINTPGFHAGVFERYVSGMVEAALQAYAARQPVTLAFSLGEFPPEVPIAFNRAIEAFKKNPGAWTDKPELAVDRAAYQITALPHGHLINWFGTHTTTIQEENLCVSSDHKGYAAELCEERGIVAAFAQSTAGDITPNHFKFPGVKVHRGPTPNPFENRRIVGRYQAEMAQHLAKAEETVIAPLLRSWWCWVDFSAVEVEEPYTRGMGRGKTGEGALGAAFLGGTLEGGGIPQEWVRVIAVLARLRGLINPSIHGTKPLVVESVSKRIFGTVRWDTLPLPATDAAIKYLQWIARQGGKYVPLPLTPQILPIQVWQLGSVAIVALPMEPTTMAGRLIRERIAPVLAPKGVQYIIIQGYSNGYAGYLTTYWEYQYQRYEGGHTHFGKHTLAAVEKSLIHLLEGKACGTAPPPYISIEQAKRILFTYELARAIG
ncbi:MAG: neutral/alkaline non-lysosomal ceramidase N-terminal domain-containing protein [Bacteroidia bacterium]|nr:neutral/alkaline non-lysosomal ceramidase N-terminal domain-containing protein [Bacteroidia bacterium]MCX7651540.1 neutral/alkaline non-lysosomal ceramidase N-terminal domain-containing protein [Bacteroidia bacterium]MDW8416264.1 neutral/alkaline non-lysosomal ceramidase N-terminal domain-containing protein [Bacteroidia bacterium]